MAATEALASVDIFHRLESCLNFRVGRRFLSELEL